MKQTQESFRSSNVSVNPIRGLIRNSDFDVDAALKASRARLERERLRIIEQYGVSTDNDVARILRIEDEQAACDGCKGSCGKDFFRYKRPHVEIVKGSLCVTSVPCPYSVNYDFRHTCRRAGIPDRYVGYELGGYRVTADNERAVKIAKYFCDNKPNRGLFLYGACGTGKTLLAAIIAQNYLRDGLNVKFFDMPGLLTDIKATFDSKTSTATFLDEICKADLLVVDDIGVEKVTDWSIEQLYLIVNRRYNSNRPLICTSNYDSNGLNRRLGDDITARRIISRLKEMCVEAFFGARDRRINQ